MPISGSSIGALPDMGNGTDPASDWTPEDQRDLIKVSGGALTSEPWDVDDIDLDAGGVPEMRLNPNTVPADRVLFGIHREGLS
jgi:hypothetical protein